MGTKQYTNEEILALTAVTDREVEVEGIGSVTLQPMSNSQNAEAVYHSQEAYGGAQGKPNGIVFMLWCCKFSLKNPVLSIEQLDRLPFKTLQALFAAVSQANGFDTEVAKRATQSFPAGRPEDAPVSPLVGARQDAPPAP